MNLGDALRAICVAGSLALVASQAAAAVVIGGPPDDDGLYTVVFDQVGLVNPVETFPGGPDVGDLTVSFGTHFAGQTLGSMHNSLSNTAPAAPLRLDPSGTVRTMFDLASPSGIALGGVVGRTMFTTPLAILFSSGVNFVAFDLGDLDQGTSTRIEAFDASGGRLGIFDNLSQGYRTYSLTETTGAPVIAGVSIYVPEDGMDWEGFGINSIKISGDHQGVVPEPATIIVWSVLIACVVSAAKWRRR